MKKFKDKKEAVKYCIDQIKPSTLGIDQYNSMRLIRNRYNKDPESIKENAIKRLFETFRVQVECTYSVAE